MLLSGVFSLALLVRPVAADAVLITSSNTRLHSLSIFFGGNVVVGQVQVSESGGPTLSNSVAIASDGADAAASYRISTLTTGTKISGQGSVLATVSQDTSGDFVGQATAFAHTENFFQLTQPHRYTYTISSSFEPGHGRPVQTISVPVFLTSLTRLMRPHSHPSSRICAWCVDPEFSGIL